MSALWRAPRLLELRPHAMDQMAVIAADSLTRAAAATGEIGQAVTAAISALIAFAQPHIANTTGWVTHSYQDLEGAVGSHMLVALGVMGAGFFAVIAAPFLVARYS